MKVEDIKKVGVAGSGVMGHSLAINSALWGYPTIMYDVSDDILEKSVQSVKYDLSIFVEEGLINRERATETEKRITTTTDIVKLAANSDFISEAIVERAKDKIELFTKLGKL